MFSCRNFKTNVNFVEFSICHEHSRMKSSWNLLPGRFWISYQVSIFIIVIYLCIHGKCNSWDYVKMARDVWLFRVWRARFPRQKSIDFTLTRHKLCAIAKYLKIMIFRKLLNLVSRQALAPASKETANTQPSSDGK